MRNILTLLLLVFLSGCAGTGYKDWTEEEQTRYKYLYAALRGESDVLSRETTLNLMNIGTTVVIINNQIVINRAF